MSVTIPTGPLSLKEEQHIREVWDNYKDPERLVPRLLATLDFVRSRGPSIGEREAISMEIKIAEKDGADARDAGKTRADNPRLNGVYDQAWDRGWHWANACHERDIYRDKLIASKQLHVATIERVVSKSNLSTARRAKCICGWQGPERGTLEMSSDDAKLHEAQAH